MKATLSGTYGQIDLHSTKLTIGRAPDNLLVLNDSQISGHHAEICSAGQGYSIIDLGSTNGTFVNDYRLIPHVPRSLASGDKLRFGPYTGNPNTLFTFTLMGIAAVGPTIRVSSSTDGPYVQQASSGAVHSTPQLNTQKKDDDKEGKWTWRDWLVKVVIPVLGILTAAGIFTVKANTPSIPQLHQTYSGHITEVGGTASLFITSVNETPEGDFAATGTDGLCPATLDNGKVATDNTISFELRETQVAGTNCGFTGEFKGSMRSDGSMSGTWNVPNTQTQGGWDLS